MLYKVTPMMAPAVPEKKKREPGEPRKRRKTAIYDHEGHEVLITLMCLKCRQIRPLMQFGLRKMADGAIRNQPWCRTCRSGASSKKPAEGSAEKEPVAIVEAPSLSLSSEASGAEEETTQPMAPSSEPALL
jgi:hypothetical protein